MSTFVRNIALKKRKTVKSKGIQRRPEVKQKNAFDNTLGYEATAIVPFVHDDGIGAWRPFELKQIIWPVGGAGSFQRVGNKINCRWLRLKGYCAIYDRLISNCNLKFYLVRCYGTNTTNLTFESCWSNWETVDYSIANLWTLMNHMRHNYYKACLRPDKVGKDKGIVVSKLGELHLHPSSHAMNAKLVAAHTVVGTGPVGQSTTLTMPVPQHAIGNAYEYEAIDNIPFDMKISLYETVDCNVDYYYLFVMQDYPYVTDDQTKSGTAFPYPAKVSGYEVNFFT